jgi:predicted nucleic-acid-binding Zn-ribbon protein
MSDHKCRNCGSSERYIREVEAKGGQGSNLLPLGIFTYAKLEIQVCGNCRLIEWYVPERFLPKVKENFERAV